MARFKFRLATLLRLRERARDERRAQLAQAYRAEEILRQQQQGVARELAELQTRSREASGPGPLDLDRLLEARRFDLVLRARQQDLRQKQQVIEEEIVRRHQALVESNRDVRVLELLRQRQLARYREEENRQEIKVLDEAAARGLEQEETV